MNTHAAHGDEPATREPAATGYQDIRILPAKVVSAITSLSRTTIWRLARAGAFPSPVRVSANRIGWTESDVRNWLADRARTRDSAGQDQ